MKSFDDLDKKINKYYEGSLEGAASDDFEIKTALDKMSLIEDIENNIQLNIDINSIVEKGQEVRINKKIRKATIKFVIFAILMCIIIGFICTKIPIYIIAAVQFVVLIALLILNSILLKKKVRSEAKCHK